MSGVWIAHPVGPRKALALVAMFVLAAGLPLACDSGSGGGSPETSAIESAAGLTPYPDLSAAPTPDLLSLFTPGPTATAYPADVAATTSGVLFPFYDASLATRKPIAVMLDDHWDARPQAGLSQADVVYQALAEGGIPRYMALFQTQDPPLIGPIRSARLYFVAWAEEWRAGYVHVAGAPNAQARLAQDNLNYIWNEDGLRWLSTSYMWRVDFRVAPHNAYTDSYQVHRLLTKIGGTSPSPPTPWAFADPTPEWLRPVGGSIVIPYRYNRIEYQYDRASNTYLRSYTSDVIRHKMTPHLDPNNGRRVAPSVVVVMYVDTYMLAGHANEKKHRLDLDYLGKGKALVFENGTVIGARWNKSKEYSQTTITYASGPNAGQRIPFVRGQIFIQVVPPDIALEWTLGTTVAPGY